MKEPVTLIMDDHSLSTSILPFLTPPLCSLLHSPPPFPHSACNPVCYLFTHLFTLDYVLLYLSLTVPLRQLPTSPNPFFAFVPYLSIFPPSFSLFPTLSPLSLFAHLASISQTPLLLAFNLTYFDIHNLFLMGNFAQDATIRRAMKRDTDGFLRSR